MAGLLLRGARLPDGQSANLAIRGGRIDAIGAELSAATDAETIDARGCLVLPGLVDGHAHLDKTLWGTPWHPHQAGPTLRERIDHERRVLSALALSPATQSARLVRHMVARGTTHVRTHVDVGPQVGLDHLHGVQRMRDAHRDWIDVQIVAFPQSGVMIQPDVLDLLDQAVLDGAEAIGGIDPIGIDGNLHGQLDAIFAIAMRRGCAIDIHLHDRGEAGALTIEKIAERTAVLGLRGRVSISHAFCLGMLEPARLEQMIALLLEHDIAIMSHAPAGGIPFPPLRLLAERGVRLFTGSDGVRDTWSPLNSGDMLERAFLLAYCSGWRRDAEIELALRMATHGGAQVMGLRDYGVAVGSVADLLLVPAETAAEAVAAHPLPRLVLKRGRIVAREGRSLLPPLH
ncbi:MAG: amidohydrolase family protein [Ideonella sp.]|nr:amidohydrolase family protein [Ideonella sp.]MCC7457144.1 amidohydrolase family protein [Nitrospira sp.]